MIVKDFNLFLHYINNSFYGDLVILMVNGYDLLSEINYEKVLQDGWVYGTAIVIVD